MLYISEKLMVEKRKCRNSLSEKNSENLSSLSHAYKINRSGNPNQYRHYNILKIQTRVVDRIRSNGKLSYAKIASLLDTEEGHRTQRRKVELLLAC
jgi:hypothetical protein